MYMCSDFADLKTANSHKLVIELWDYDVINHDFIGCMTFNVADIMAAPRSQYDRLNSVLTHSISCAPIYHVDRSSD
jgi:hypothetical protein